MAREKAAEEEEEWMARLLKDVEAGEVAKEAERVAAEKAAEEAAARKAAERKAAEVERQQCGLAEDGEEAEDEMDSETERTWKRTEVKKRERRLEKGE